MWMRGALISRSARRAEPGSSDCSCHEAQRGVQAAGRAQARSGPGRGAFEVAGAPFVEHPFHDVVKKLFRCIKVSYRGGLVKSAGQLFSLFVLANLVPNVTPARGHGFLQYPRGEGHPRNGPKSGRNADSID